MGDIPHQYGHDWEGDDRESPESNDAELSVLQPLRYGWGVTCPVNSGGDPSKPRLAFPSMGVTYILYDSGDMLYSVVMSTMAVSEAREKLSDAVEAAQTEPVFLERYGRPAAVLVSPERYEELMEALEDAEDVAAFDEAMAEDGANIPWEQVKADLGWT